MTHYIRPGCMPKSVNDSGDLGRLLLTVVILMILSSSTYGYAARVLSNLPLLTTAEYNNNLKLNEHERHVNSISADGCDIADTDSAIDVCGTILFGTMRAWLRALRRLSIRFIRRAHVIRRRSL